MSIGNDLGSSIVNEKSSNATVEVEVTSLDEYFADVKQKVAFIKMNIEGAEIAALNGAKIFMDRNEVDLNICTDHLVDGELTYVAVEKIFAELGMPHQTLRDGIHINTHATNI